MATSTAPSSTPAPSGLISGFVTDLRSQYQTTTPGGGAAVNWNNAAKDTFNSGIIGLGYGLAETRIGNAPLNPAMPDWYNARATAGNLHAARVIRGLGQALGCTMDVVEAVGNASQGNNAAATCNVASCLGGVGGGWVGGVAFAPAGPLASFAGSTGLGFLGGKAAEYACKRYFDLPTGSQPASGAPSSVTGGASITTPERSAGLAQTAANVVQFRPSPDYTGNDGTYTVSRGQTLSSIAQANGVTVQALIAANPQITDPNSIRTGQTIKLPDNASGYTPALSSSDATTSSSNASNATGVPNNDAQIQSLTGVLGDVQGNFSILTENSGRIAVVNPDTGEVTLINNDGSTSAQSFDSYWQAAETNYQAQVNAGIILSDEPVGVFDLNAGAGLIAEGAGQGVMFDATGVVVVDAQGNTLLMDAETETTIAVNAQTGEITTQDANGERVAVNTFADAVNQIELPAAGLEVITPDTVAVVSNPTTPTLNTADIPLPDLTSHFTGGASGGAYGAGTLAGFDVLPLNENTSFLVNADGDIAGEIRNLGNGYFEVKDLSGNAVYVSEANGQAFSAESYQQAQQQAADAQTSAQYGQTATALGLMQSIIGLQNWDSMSDLQRVASVASIYNSFDNLSGGNALPGDLGSAVSVLGFINALDRGDVGGSVYSGLSMVEALTSTTTISAAGVASTSGWVTANMPGGDAFLPGLGFALALDSGNPISIVSSVMNH